MTDAGEAEIIPFARIAETHTKAVTKLLRFTRNTIAGLAVLALGVGGVIQGCTSYDVRSLLRRDVYKGALNIPEFPDQPHYFTYVERIPNNDQNSRFLANQLTLKIGGTLYTFIDSAGETDIDWNNEAPPPFQNDSLETIIVGDASGMRTFLSSDINSTTQDETTSRETLTAFNRGNTFYNTLRGQIRDILRSKTSMAATPATPTPAPTTPGTVSDSVSDPIGLYTGD